MVAAGQRDARWLGPGSGPSAPENRRSGSSGSCLFPFAGRPSADEKRVVAQAYAEVRQAIFGLKLVSPKLGLIPALTEYLPIFGEQTGLDVELHSADERATRLSPQVEVQLIRISQAALTNARKHVQATRARVRFEADTQEARVRIEDKSRCTWLSTETYRARRALPEPAWHLSPISRATATKLLDEFARLIRGQREEVRLQGRLSPREQEILQLLTQGATNKEIVTTLNTSENTVKNHLKNILEKLHLQDRVQAAAYALCQGLLPHRKA